jgi:hypothetical protein
MLARSARIPTLSRRQDRSPLFAGILFVLAAALPVASPGQQPPAAPPDTSNPIAIVPIDSTSKDQAQVTGALQLSGGSAFILANGTVTSGATTTNVVLPHRGVLRVCASTVVSLTADKSVPEGETPGLMMAIAHGAVEASFATGRNSDILLTPDFRILIGGPGAVEVKVRLGEHGDTCIDNPGADAPYVLVSSVFEGGAYRVQPGQRVMFQHGSLKEVVDQEKEPCGCPPASRPESNDFPLAQSAGLVPLHNSEPAPPAPSAPEQPHQPLTEPLVFPPPAQPPPAEPKTQESPAQPIAAPEVSAPPAAPAAAPPKPKQKPSFLHSVGRFFRRIFGAD